MGSVKPPEHDSPQIGAVFGQLLAGKPDRRADRRPNIILILADDMGFGDLGVMGSEIRTRRASVIWVRISARPAKRLPAVAQLAQFHEYRTRIRMLRQIGERLAQACDHHRVLQPEKRIDFPFFIERGDPGIGRLMGLRLA